MGTQTNVKNKKESHQGTKKQNSKRKTNLLKVSDEKKSHKDNYCLRKTKGSRLLQN